MSNVIDYDYDYLLAVWLWLWLQFCKVIKCDYDYMTKVIDYNYDYNEIGLRLIILKYYKF